MAIVTRRAVVFVTVNLADVLVIHQCAVVLVTTDAGVFFLVGRCRVARQAIVPAPVVGARKDWKEQAVVVTKIAGVAGGMAAVTSG